MGSILGSAWAFRWEQAPMIRRFNHEMARHGPDGTFADRLGTYLSYEHYASPERMHVFRYHREVRVVVLGDKYYIVDTKDPVIRAFDATGKLVRELQPHMPLEPRRPTSAARDPFRTWKASAATTCPVSTPTTGSPGWPKAVVVGHSQRLSPAESVSRQPRSLPRRGAKRRDRTTRQRTRVDSGHRATAGCPASTAARLHLARISQTHRKAPASGSC